MSKKKTIYLLMILTAFIWGGTFNAAGFALTGLHPLAAAFIRFAVATAIFLISGYREICSTPIQRSDWLKFFLLGLTGIFAYNVFFMYALKYTSAVNGSLITAVNPIVTAILAALLLKEKFTLRLGGGALLSFIGVVLVTSAGSWETIRSFDFNFGDILILGSVFSFSLYTIVGKTVSSAYSPMITTFYSFLTGTLLLAPFGLSSKPGPGAIVNAGLPAIVAILYLALIGSVLAYFWWNKGVAALGAGRAAIFINLIPVATIVISLFFGEPIRFTQAAGCVLIIGAVMLASGGRPGAPGS